MYKTMVKNFFFTVVATGPRSAHSYTSAHLSRVVVFSLVYLPEPASPDLSEDLPAVLEEGAGPQERGVFARAHILVRDDGEYEGVAAANEEGKREGNETRYCKV